jgi:TolB-like protein/tRNA A-37 threonylcarbamoyl transferase component Bud32/tetratricopeptide (TPR) repeat protein
MPDTPQSFDGFEVERVLGKGGMGTVYLAKDQRLGRNVAVKVLNASELAYDDRRARFFREAKSAAAIRHQNVATIYDVDETADGQPFIVMEYCEGETLSQRIRRRPLDSAEFLSIARQIAAGVSAAHEQSIVHRDIKSANIIVERSGIVKILDFGLAKSLPRSITDPGAGERTFDSTTGHFFGTLHFISPEQARGQNADARSDLFSVGVVLYHMASGHLPFNADAPLMVLDKIREGEPEPFVPLDPSFPPAAAKIISRLLQKNPDDRYQTARDLLADLEEIDTPTIRMTTSTSRTALGRTVRRSSNWMRAAVTVGAALIIAAAIFLVRRGGVTNGAAGSTSAGAAPIRSMAVLPLRNIANNTQDDFLSVGLADALVTKLQQIPSLQVRPTSAVLEFQGEKVDTKEATKKLKVDGVLEGHFLAAGDLVRVTLQLTDSRTGFSIWSDTVDGRRDNLLKLIDDVSTRTVSGLNEKIGVQEPQLARSEARSANPKAYEEYLKARALNGSFVPQHFAEQIAALKRAVALDPTFAAAYADLATTLSLGVARSLAAPEDVQRAEWYARQAVRLDPNLPEAHLALGRVFVRDPERYRESVREVLAALRLEATDTQALNSMVTYFVSTGDMQNAQCIGNRLLQLDPMSNEAKTRGYWYVNAVDPEGALANAKYAMDSRDTAIAGHDIRAYAFLLQGDLAAAEREANEAAKLVPGHYLGKSLKAMIAAARGDRAASEAAMRTFATDSQRTHWAAFRVALCYAKLGDNAQAVEWMKRAASLGNHSWYALIKHPWLQPLQTDPEFQQIVGTMKADLDDVRDDVVGVYQLLCK